MCDSGPSKYWYSTDTDTPLPESMKWNNKSNSNDDSYNS